MFEMEKSRLLKEAIDGYSSGFAGEEAFLERDDEIDADSIQGFWNK